MEKTSKKAISIKELIEKLEEWKKTVGEEAEVFIVNEEEATFDGVGKMFAIQTVEPEMKGLAIMRGE